ncbi:hypothetical protein ACM6Q7_12160 [Peribacillus butanolivorans]
MIIVFDFAFTALSGFISVAFKLLSGAACSFHVVIIISSSCSFMISINEHIHEYIASFFAKIQVEVIFLEPNNPGNKELPDFKDLNDRIIAQPSQSPRLVIKTNLDTKNVTDKNPYTDRISSEGFNEYFEES